MTTSTPIVEVRWLWRRIFTFVSCALAYGVLILVVLRTADPAALRWIGLSLVGLIAVSHAIYLTGATVTDWARLAAAARGEGPEGKS